MQCQAGQQSSNCRLLCHTIQPPAAALRPLPWLAHLRRQCLPRCCCLCALVWRWVDPHGPAMA
jgi:hypothetical protein